MVDFQERTIFGTPPGEIVQAYGPPARRVETRTGFVMIYDAIDGKVAVNFENQKVEGVAWSGKKDKNDVGLVIGSELVRCASCRLNSNG